MVPQLQVVGQVPKKYLSISLFDIHVRLCRCIKIWMVKIWQIFGQLSISPNFSSTKVLLHALYVTGFEKRRLRAHNSKIHFLAPNDSCIH